MGCSITDWRGVWMDNEFPPEFRRKIPLAMGLAQKGYDGDSGDDDGDASNDQDQRQTAGFFNFGVTSDGLLVGGILLLILLVLLLVLMWWCCCSDSLSTDPDLEAQDETSETSSYIVFDSDVGSQPGKSSKHDVYGPMPVGNGSVIVNVNENATCGGGEYAPSDDASTHVPDPVDTGRVYITYLNARNWPFGNDVEEALHDKQHSLVDNDWKTCMGDGDVTVRVRRFASLSRNEKMECQRLLGMSSQKTFHQKTSALLESKLSGKDLADRANDLAKRMYPKKAGRNAPRFTPLASAVVVRWWDKIPVVKTFVHFAANRKPANREPRSNSAPPP